MRSANSDNDRGTIDVRQLRRELAAYHEPSRSRSAWQLVNTLIPYALLWVLAYYALQYSFWAALPIMILNAGFLIRTFILFHDCGHHSLFRSRRANDIWGIVTGILTFTPYYLWRENHSRHHVTSGNLDKRGQGDVWMMTVAEYQQATPRQRLQYRLYRNPLIMFFLGPLLISLITHRLVRREVSRRERLNLYVTNLGIVLMAVVLSLVIGLKSYLIIQGLTLYLALIMGVWLFYIQHQFDGVYWARDDDLDFVKSSLDGASFYKLPSVLNWFSGNIGYHHIHHLNPRIPNYNLAKCWREIPLVNQVRPLKFLSGFKSLKYRLWDEENLRLVGFKDVPG